MKVKTENNKSAIPRFFAIGDVHGCLKELETLIEAISPTENDTLIFLGDYVDRGEYSKEVLSFIMQLKSRYNVIVLLGNHEAMMRNAFDTRDTDTRLKWAEIWLKNGGDMTMDSYDVHPSVLFDVNFNSLAFPKVLQEHLGFLDTLPLKYVTDTHIFTHASPHPKIDIDMQDEMALTWRVITKVDKECNYHHVSGKQVVSGHTAQRNGKPAKISDGTILIDSGCFFTGWITALNVYDGTCIQAGIGTTRHLKALCITNPTH